jgi:hypothetical protein
MLDPERAVLIECRDALFGRHEIGAGRVGSGPHEFQDGVLGCAFVPRRQRIGLCIRRSSGARARNGTNEDGDKLTTTNIDRHGSPPSLAPLGMKARNRERVRCASLIDRPVYTRLRRTMRASTDARNAGTPQHRNAAKNPATPAFMGDPPGPPPAVPAPF